MVQRLPFTVEELRTAVAANRSYAATARQLGYKRGSAQMVKRMIAAYEISTEHFGGNGFHTGRSPNFTYSAEQLAEAVRSSRTMSDVCRKLGRTPVSGRSLVEKIKQAGLDTSHFMTRSEFSSAKYAPGYRARTPERILVLNPPGSNRVQASTLRRLMIKEGKAHECAVCGQPPEWLGQPLTLHVDHVDGDWLNNLLSNLRFLCPNCHEQQPTTRDKKRRHHVR